jgi:hypothetical protein
MGIWRTKIGNKHNVNIEQSHILSMKANGARFCWFNDNPGISDKNNDKYYEDKTEGEETYQILRQGIKVCCEDGETLTGYVTHYVNGIAAATDIKKWFIFQPGTYPTIYSRVVQGSQKDEDVTIEEL